MRANTFMWTGLGCMYALDGAPLLAALAFFVLAISVKVIFTDNFNGDDR